MRAPLTEKRRPWVLKCSVAGLWFLLFLGPPDGGFAAEAALASMPPQVTLAMGTLQGARFGEDEHAVAYLGVPYADPPTGERRWRPPQQVRAWAGIRKATTFGAACPQLPAKWLPTLPWSEDCLYLNVWSNRPSRTTRKQPVIVYFHGGSNMAGYSQLNPLGPAFSKLGIVFVSANYRLGPFGFLAHPALTAESVHHASGNYGLLDQILVLEWVRENVARFGGDPRRITVMGQSAGAVDICLLMASPQARGLFQRAILQSGECQSVLNQDRVDAVHYNQLSEAVESSGKRFAEALPIRSGSNVAAELRTISAADILDTWSRNRSIQFAAIVDGWIVPEQPAKIFAEGREMKIPILVGSNADEATVFGHGGPNSAEEYRRYLRADTGRWADAEFAAYPVASDAEVAGRYLELQNESFAYGAYSMARAISRIGQPSFLYRFSYAESGPRASLGAYHGEELYFLSDAYPPDWHPSAAEMSLGRMLRAYWTQFAKTGDPNIPGTPRWPPYDERTDEFLEIGSSIRSRPVEPRVHTLERIMSKVATRSSC